MHHDLLFELCTTYASDPSKLFHLDSAEHVLGWHPGGWHIFQNAQSANLEKCFRTAHFLNGTQCRATFQSDPF